MGMHSYYNIHIVDKVSLWLLLSMRQKYAVHFDFCDVRSLAVCQNYM